MHLMELKLVVIHHDLDAVIALILAVARLQPRPESCRVTVYTRNIEFQCNTGLTSFLTASANNYRKNVMQEQSVLNCIFHTIKC